MTLAETTPTDETEAPEPTLSAADKGQIAAALALDKKAEEPILIEVTALASYTDVFLVVSALSDRQVGAVASHVEDEMKKIGLRPLSVEGKRSGNWILLDYGDLIVHLFIAEARGYYDIEGFWKDAPRIDVDEERGQALLQELAA